MKERRVMRKAQAVLLAGATFIAFPAFAQDATPQEVSPPPIVTSAPAPAPVERQIVIEPAAPVVQSVPSVAEQQANGPAPREAAPRAASPVRNATVTRTTTTTARAAAPAPAPAEVAPAPVEQAQPAPAAPVAQPAPEAAQPAPQAPADVSVTERSASTTIAWPWLAGGVLLVIAGFAAFLLGRRNDEQEFREESTAVAMPGDVPEPPVAPRKTAVAAPAYREEPLRRPIAEPEVAAAIEEAELHDAKQDDLAGVADAPAPVARRPWLEFGMRPVRAGTNEEEAIVDFELTIGNAGDQPARDVAISAFMLMEPEGSDMERLLMEHRSDTVVPPVTIQPGDGTRVDAHLAVPKEDLGRVFNPVVVAEARYRLPDGSEGRTSAAFRIGRQAHEGGLGAIGSARPQIVEDLTAELYGVPEHA
jgi:hypothetical protein